VLERSPDSGEGVDLPFLSELLAIEDDHETQYKEHHDSDG
jgi:hypothetical protein